MALYELTLIQRAFQQVTVNRWNYQTSGTPAAVTGAFALVSAFGGIAQGVPPEIPLGTIANAIQYMQTDDVEFISINAFNIYDAVDFYGTPFPSGTTGDHDDVMLSPASAYGFRTNRTRRDIRRGMKRFVGVGQSTVGDGGIIIGDGVTRTETLADLMGQNIEYDDEGNTITFEPVVVSKEKVVDPVSGAVTYRYYPTLVEQEAFLATSVLWEVYPETRTQRSRQYGQGV